MDAGLVILTPIYLRVVPVWVEATEGLFATELDEGARSCGWPRPVIAHSREARAAHVRGQHRLAFRHVLAQGNSTGRHCARYPAVFDHHRRRGLRRAVGPQRRRHGKRTATSRDDPLRSGAVPTISSFCSRIATWLEHYPDPRASAKRNAARRDAEDRWLTGFAGLDELSRPQVEELISWKFQSMPHRK